MKLRAAPESRLLRAVPAEPRRNSPRLRPVATDEAGHRRLLDAVLLLLDEARRKGILPP